MSIRLLDPSGTTPAEHKCMKPVPALEEFIVLQKIIHPQTHPLNTAPFQSCPSLAFSTINSVVLLNSASLCIWPVVSTKVQAFLGDSVLYRSAVQQEGGTPVGVNGIRSCSQAVLWLHCFPSLPEGEWRHQQALLASP